MEASPEPGAAVSICGEFLLWNKSELRHRNDGTATVRVSHYTQCIAAWRKVRHVTFNNDGTVTVRVSHYIQCTAA